MRFNRAPGGAVTYMVRLSCILVLATTILFPLNRSASAEPDVIFLGAVDQGEKQLISAIVQDASSLFRQSFGLDLNGKTKVFISNSPLELAEAYVRHRRLSRSAIADKVKRYAELSVAEATYRGLYINVGSRRYPSSSRVRRANMVFHELFHLLQYELVGRRSAKCCRSDRVPVVGPVWLMEGSSEYFARVLLERNGYERMRGYLNHAARVYRSNGAQPLKQLETRNGMDRVQNSYDIGAYGVHMLVERTGLSSIPSFYAKLGAGKNWKRAFSEAFGIKPEEFYVSIGN